MIAAIIIDDERKAIESLRTDLRWYCEHEVEVVGDAQTLDDGLALIQSLAPQLVFLDIQIGSENGLMLLEKINKMERGIHVIFTTGHANFAVNALRNKAFDYLLKPIDPDELKAAVKRLAQELQGKAPAAAAPMEATLALPMQDQIRICKLSEIMRCESESNYTRFFLSDKTMLLVAKTLGSFESQLPESQFFRPHKSHIVNLSYIESYMRQDGGYIQMSDGSAVPLARNQRQRLFELLGIA